MIGKYSACLIGFLIVQTSQTSPYDFFKPQKHNNHLQSQVGPYRIHNELSREQRDGLLGEIREFLWEHWKERRAGRVTAVFYTIEGDPTTSTFFVKQDHKGRWRLRVSSKSTKYFGIRPSQRPRREVIDEKYDIVERILDVSGEDPEMASALPDIEVRPPKTYRLRLKSSKQPGQRPAIIL